MQCCAAPDMHMSTRRAGRVCNNCKAVERGGHGPKQRLREPADEQGKFNFSVRQLIAIASNNPAKIAEIMTASRRPTSVGKCQFEIATRKAAGDNMLSASGDSVEFGLDHRNSRVRVQLGELQYNLIIKPSCLKTAKMGRKEGWWGERLWGVYAPRYATGLLAVTDCGHQTTIFPTQGELHSAIKRSGWEIVTP